MKRIIGFSSIPVDRAASGGAERIAELYRHLPADRFDTTLVTLTGMRDRRGTVELPGKVRNEKIPSPAQSLFHHLGTARLVPFFQVHRFHDAFPLGAEAFLREGADIVQFDSL